MIACQSSQSTVPAATPRWEADGILRADLAHCHGATREGCTAPARSWSRSANTLRVATCARKRQRVTARSRGNSVETLYSPSRVVMCASVLDYEQVPRRTCRRRPCTLEGHLSTAHKSCFSRRRKPWSAFCSRPGCLLRRSAHRDASLGISSRYTAAHADAPSVS